MNWVAAIPDPVWVLIGVIVTAAITYLTARLTSRAQQQKNLIDQDQNAGTMALSLAKQLRDELTGAREELAAMRDELDELRDHHREVDDWYDEHRRWDQAVTREIERLEPGASARLPHLRAMPHLAHQR